LATLVHNKEFEVFVSYNREDHAIVAEVVRRLHDEGIRTWLDRNDIDPGQVWTIALEDALTTMPVIAVCLGAHGLGEYQYKEIRRAIEQRKDRKLRIIPVKLPGSAEHLPLDLNDIQCCDFTGPFGLEDDEQFRKLARAIRGESANSEFEEELTQQELRAAILDYYKTQETDCEHLVFTPRRDKDHITGSDVYVPLYLLTKRGPVIFVPQEDSTAAAKESPPGQQSAPEEHHLTWERESWEAVFRNDGLRLVFTGNAGSGKSFSLTQEIRKRLAHARKELENSCPLHELELPILVKASALVSPSHEKVADILLASFTESARSRHFRNWWHHAFNSERGRRLLIIIDGLDELSEDSESLFRRRMRELDVLESASLVISCRTAYFGSRRDWLGWANSQTKLIEIAPLDNQQQLDLIDKWFGDSDRAHAVRLLLENNYAAKDLCRTPIVLTLLCRGHGTDDIPEELTYASLYAFAIKGLFAGGWRDPDKRPQWVRDQSKNELTTAIEDRMRWVSRIAWNLFENSGSENRFTREAWMEAAARISPKPGARDIDVSRLLIDLELVGILVEEGRIGHQQCYSFAHRTLLEHFAAEGLVEQESGWIDKIVEHMWCDSSWEVVIRFAASINRSENDSEELLKAIAKETGNATTPVRPLQRVDKFCGKAARVGLIGLLVIMVIAFAGYLFSPEVSDRIEKNRDRLAASFESTSKTELLDSPLHVINQRILNLLEFYSATLDSFYRDLPVGPDQRKYVDAALGWIHFSFPILSMMLFVGVLGSVLTKSAKRILYRESLPRQDDIFRTGLRIQAEIVGLNPRKKGKDPHTPGKPRISEDEVRRVVLELLASERDKSLNIHGAGDDGCIPESLLLLLGGNSDARAILHDRWVALVKQRTKKLRGKNRLYKRILSVYSWLLRHLAKTDADPLLRPDDLDLGPVSMTVRFSPTASNYVIDKLSADMQDELRDRSSKWSAEQLKSALVTDLNELIQGPSLHDPMKFRLAWLRAETIELIARKPAGGDLARLNRLLLEDAFPKTIRRFQSRSRRFANWCVWRFVLTPPLWAMEPLRSLEPGSELDRAFKGMLLLPSTASRKDISLLIMETDKAANYLLNAAETGRTFTELDIYCAKILALTGGAIEKERFIELAHRRSEGNTHTPLAVKELSSIDKSEGIRAAALCLAEEWKESSYNTWHRASDFVDVFRNAEFNEVIVEVFKLDVPIKELWKNVVVSWVAGSGAERELYQRIADNEVLPQYAREMARENLQSSSLEELLHSVRWLNNCAKEIRRDLERDDLEAAVRSFDRSISSYYVNYGANKLVQALDNLASACNESLLDRWFETRKSISDLLHKVPILARLGRGSNGRIVEQALLKWVKTIDLETIVDDGFDIRQAAIRALGEMEKKDGGLFIMALLQRGLSRRGWRHAFKSTYFDSSSFWINLVTALAKIEANEANRDLNERDEMFQTIQRTARDCQNWVIYHVAARAMYSRDPIAALELLLKGNAARGKGKWSTEYGVEPQLHGFADACHARIRKIDQDATSSYVATSQIFKHPIRVPF